MTITMFEADPVSPAAEEKTVIDLEPVRQVTEEPEVIHCFNKEHDELGPVEEPSSLAQPEEPKTIRWLIGKRSSTSKPLIL